MEIFVVLLAAFLYCVTLGVAHSAVTTYARMRYGPYWTNREGAVDEHTGTRDRARVRP